MIHKKNYNPKSKTIFHKRYPQFNPYIYCLAHTNNRISRFLNMPRTGNTTWHAQALIYNFVKLNTIIPFDLDPYYDDTHSKAYKNTKDRAYKMVGMNPLHDNFLYIPDFRDDDNPSIRRYTDSYHTDAICFIEYGHIDQTTGMNQLIRIAMTEQVTNRYVIKTANELYLCRKLERHDYPRWNRNPIGHTFKIYPDFKRQLQWQIYYDTQHNTIHMEEEEDD